MEDGIQASRTPLGSIGTHDTSKGTHHELSLAYKTWIPQAIHAHEESLGGGASLPDLTQRFFLGWDAAGLLDRAKASEPRQPLNWTAAKDLYDLGLACLGDLPLFLSDWTPAEYISGRYDPQTRELRLAFRSHEGEPFRVRLYSQRAVQEVTLNDEPLKEGWRYDPQSGWLAVDLQGADTKHLLLRLGDPAAPLHPYFTERAK